MIQNGEILNPSLVETEENLVKENKLAEYINVYFNNPTLIKIKDIKEDKVSMYATKLYCMLKNEFRYLMVVSKIDNFPIGSKNYIRNLKWESIQTRSLDQNYNIPIHTYQPSSFPPLSSHIFKESVVNNSHTIYKCKDFPIKILVFHTKHTNEYPNEATIIHALQTFQTIIYKE